MPIYRKELKGVSINEAYAEMEEVQEAIEDILNKNNVNFKSPFEKIPGKINIYGDVEIWGYLEGIPNGWEPRIMLQEDGEIMKEIEERLEDMGYSKVI